MAYTTGSFANYLHKASALAVGASQSLHILIILEEGTAFRAAKCPFQLMCGITKPLYLGDGYLFRLRIIMRKYIP